MKQYRDTVFGARDEKGRRVDNATLMNRTNDLQIRFRSSGSGKRAMGTRVPNNSEQFARA